MALILLLAGCSGSADESPLSTRGGGAVPEAGSIDPPRSVPDSSAPGAPGTNPTDARTETAIADAGNEARRSSEAGGIIAGRRLTWSDEFDGPAGGAPDPAKWRYQTGGTGFGNNEIEYYTNRRENSYLDGSGHLVIEARAEAFSGRSYTSARINTNGVFSQRNGRFEARIQLPGGGKGVWPAFWALGSNISTVGWPRCGEVDIMENRGSEPTMNHGSAHGPGFSGGQAFTRAYALPGGQRFPDDFHEFAIEWEDARVRWFVDGQLYNTMIPADLAARGTTWVFNGPMFIILNVAVGGNFDGNPTATTQFPTQMIVDYVRVYDVN